MSNPYPHRAKKKFGQHFLSDSAILASIVDAINPLPADRVIEIGPGPGILTTPLAEAVGQLELIEIDRDWAAVLQDRYTTQQHITLHNRDVLAFDWSELPAGEPWRVVGNLPYNISTPLLFHLFGSLSLFTDMHFVLQHEVVQRLTASVDSSHYGRLSIMAQVHCKATELLFIPPESFDPPPKVNSALVRLTPHSTNKMQPNDPKLFADIVRQAFNFRRKTLSNALKVYFTAQELIDLGIDPKKRPQNISVAEYLHLANSK